MTKRAYRGARIFDGQRLWENRVLLRDGATCLGIEEKCPSGFDDIPLQGGLLMPGFVDLQANGGGGVMLNDAPNLDTLRLMAKAHWATGTRGVLATLITDTPDKTIAAIAAVRDALAENIPGITGLHLEGPHLSVARKGTHAAELIRPMTPADETVLIGAAAHIPNLMITVAPESVTPDQITRLSKAGVLVSLGHSDCSYETAMTCFAAGARAVTHLFNAMSQMQPRAPGLVAAALTAEISTGLIADGIHVHPATLAAAMRASTGQPFLVTDCMATLGSDIDSFHLNGRRISRNQGRLTLDDGTLAGADLTMPQAIRVMVNDVGIDLETTLKMATTRPAKLLRDPGTLGTLAPNSPWTGIYLDDALHLREID